MAKQVDLSQFGAKLDVLHEKMNRIRSEIFESALTDGLISKNKSLFSSTNKTVMDWKKHIRKIEAKYNEVLY